MAALGGVLDEDYRWMVLPLALRALAAVPNAVAANTIAKAVSRLLGDWPSRSCVRPDGYTHMEDGNLLWVPPLPTLLGLMEGEAQLRNQLMQHISEPEFCWHACQQGYVDVALWLVTHPDQAQDYVSTVLA